MEKYDEDFLREFAKAEGITDENGFLKESDSLKKQRFKYHKYYLIAAFDLGNGNLKFATKYFEHSIYLEKSDLLSRKLLTERQLYEMIGTNYNLKEELERHCKLGEGLHAHYHVFHIDDEHCKISPVFGYHTIVDTAFADCYVI